MSALGDKPPRRQVGSSVASIGAPVMWPRGVPGWSALDGGSRDRVPELHPPRDCQQFDYMLTNPQVFSLFLGMLLPLLDYDLAIEPGDAEAGPTEALAADLGLPVGLPEPGDNAPALGLGAFNFDFLEHMWEALYGVGYGRWYFELVGEFTPDDGYWHLTELAARTPHDISDYITDEAGNLRAIMFPGVERVGRFALTRDVPIPAEQLAPYVWLPNARRRWLGHAMLRRMYEPWLLRDKAVRIDIVNHEKAGGVPHVETDETWQGGDLTELQQLASAFRVGQESGAALPPGAQLKLLRMGGTDVIATARYHDEVMARVWGSMVRQLGSTATGSRALGDTMQDMESVMRRAIMRWFASSFRLGVIAKWWAWNVGPSAYPSLAWRPRDDGQVPGDPAVEEEPVPPPLARSPRAAGRSGAAPRSTIGEGNPGGQHEALSAARGGRISPNTRMDLAAAARIPDRPLRRQPTAIEVRAAVDFAAMDLTYERGVMDTEALLEGTWLPDLTQQAEDAVAFTKQGTVRKRLTRLDAARIRITAPDPEPLVAIMLDAARAGAAAAAAEMAEQGTPVIPPGDDALERMVRDHALAVAQQAADGVALAAARRAVQVNAGRTPGEVASEVSTYLRGLAHQWERDQLRGAVQAATNMARLEVFERVPSEAAEFFEASELLDASTCGPCAAIDGYMFTDLSEARRLYPTGGYVDCAGGPRCRGTIIAVLHEPEPVFPPGLGPG